MANKKTLKKIIKAIKKDNKDFEKLPINEKRIAIAKDAISQLKKEKFLAVESCYISFEGDDAMEAAYEKAITKAEDETEFRDVLKKVPQCEVCARGALFVSSVRLFNNFNVGAMKKCEAEEGNNSPGYDSIKKIEKRFFSVNQIGLIELAFEGDEYVSKEASDANNYDNESSHAFRFFGFYQDATDRMIAIMQNIIDNGGKFVPSKDKRILFETLEAAEKE
jgi:hypothetical protein